MELSDQLSHSNCPYTPSFLCHSGRVGCSVTLISSDPFIILTLSSGGEDAAAQHPSHSCIARVNSERQEELSGGKN